MAYTLPLDLVMVDQNDPTKILQFTCANITSNSLFVIEWFSGAGQSFPTGATTEGTAGYALISGGGGGAANTWQPTAYVSGLTANRMPFAQTSSILIDSADLTWDNTGKILSTKGLIVGANKISSYAGVATVRAGVPSIVATSTLTAQSAAISATTIYAVPAAGAGMYRVSWVASVTTAATNSSILGGANGFQVVYTDPTDSVAKTSNATTTTAFTSAGNTTATTVGGVAVAKCKASTNLQFSFDYTSVGVTVMVYDLDIAVEFLG